MKRAAWLLIAVLAATGAQAQYFRWVDEQGKTHFGDRPPPSAAGKAETMRYGAPGADKQPPFAVRQAMANFPVALYVSPDCGEYCQAGRDYLKLRGIPFAEKDASSPESATALAQLLEGNKNVVPVLTVGPKHARGWQREDWARLLDAAGYPKVPAR